MPHRNKRRIQASEKGDSAELARRREEWRKFREKLDHVVIPAHEGLSGLSTVLGWQG